MIHAGRRSVASPRQVRRKRSFTAREDSIPSARGGGRGGEGPRGVHWQSMLRLVAYAPDGVRRFPVHRSELIIGSFPECDICLPYTGVAQRHARLLYDGNELRIEDLGSRRGLLVSGRKVKEASLEVLDEIRLGVVTLLVEDVVPGPENPAPPPRPEPSGPPRITPERMIEHLNRISEWVLADAESRTTSEALVEEVLADFGGGALFLLLGEEENAGVKLVVATDVAWLASGEGLLEQILRHRSDKAAEPTAAPNRCFEGDLAGSPAWICHLTFGAMDRKYAMMVAFPRFRPEELGWSPMAALSGLGHLLVLGLVHHVGWYEPILPGHPGQQDLTLDPNLVVGESLVMKQVVEQLRADLAYRLSQLVIDVPPLRDRREDLPLLIQSYINRFCHETGKRMQGITVKAMSALLSYDYPGNLAELENIARQLVYMAPAKGPVDVNLLPDRVRNGTLMATTRVHPASDLELEHLVTATQQSAIREALRRTNGNKSQAARLLGLSRNGLAIKMERYGLKA